MESPGSQRAAAVSTGRSVFQREARRTICFTTATDFLRNPEYRCFLTPVPPEIENYIVHYIVLHIYDDPTQVRSAESKELQI